MDPIIKIFAVAILIALAFLSFWSLRNYKPPKTEPKKSSVEINGHKIEVEIADSAAEQSYGLMNRTDLDGNTGMLFVFDYDAPHTFWMKNTLIPLDMIWINKEGQVVYVYENAQPCGDSICNSIIPKGIARYVLEINGGEVQKLGIKKGDSIAMSL